MNEFIIIIWRMELYGFEWLTRSGRGKRRRTVLGGRSILAQTSVSNTSQPASQTDDRPSTERSCVSIVVESLSGFECGGAAGWQWYDKALSTYVHTHFTPANQPATDTTHWRAEETEQLLQKLCLGYWLAARRAGNIVDRSIVASVSQFLRRRTVQAPRFVT